jgi:hypothetical protein
MWEKPYISIFVEIGAVRNFTHFGGHLKNDCQNDRHFKTSKKQREHVLPNEIDG